MNRFMYSKKRKSHNLIISVLLFLLIAGLFYFGTDSWSGTASKEQKATLERTLQESIVHCYCVEGRYPQSLKYLQDNYGISYDKSRYFVDYQPIGENIMPDITVIERAVQ